MAACWRPHGELYCVFVYLHMHIHMDCIPFWHVCIVITMHIIPHMCNNLFRPRARWLRMLWRWPFARAFMGTHGPRRSALLRNIRMLIMGLNSFHSWNLLDVSWVGWVRTLIGFPRGAFQCRTCKKNLTNCTIVPMRSDCVPSVSKTTLVVKNLLCS